MVVNLPEGTYTNTATALTTSNDPDLDNNEASVTTTVEKAPEPENDSGGGGGGGGGGGCFIATAAYGSPLVKEVRILHQFRDQYLLPFHAGKLLVHGYYYSSPPIAAFISHHPVIKEAVRVALWPVVWWAQLTLQSPPLAFLVTLGWLIINLSLLFLVFQFWQRRRTGDL